MNILLYENRTVPDMELMQATSSRGAASINHASDDEDETHRKGPNAPKDANQTSYLAIRMRNK